MQFSCLANFYPCDVLAGDIAAVAKKKPDRSYIDIDYNQIYEKIVDNNLKFCAENYKICFERANLLIDGVKNYYQCLDIVKKINESELLNLRQFKLNVKGLLKNIYSSKYDRYNSLYSYNVPYWGDHVYNITTVLICNGIMLLSSLPLYGEPVDVFDRKMLYTIFRDEDADIQLFITSKDQFNFTIELYPIKRVKGYYSETDSSDNLFRVKSAAFPLIYFHEIESMILRRVFIPENIKKGEYI